MRNLGTAYIFRAISLPKRKMNGKLCQRQRGRYPRQFNSREKQRHVRETRRKELDIRNRDGQCDLTQTCFSPSDQGRRGKKGGGYGGDGAMLYPRCSSFPSHSTPCPIPRIALLFSVGDVLPTPLNRLASE